MFIDKFTILAEFLSDLFQNNTEFINYSKTFTDDLGQLYKHLRNFAANGMETQNKITSNKEFFTLTKLILGIYNSTHKILHRMIFQCIANLCVKNKKSQEIIWNQLHHILMQNAFENISENYNVCVMIFYNMFLEKNNVIYNYDEQIYKNLLTIKIDEMGFVNLLIEHFLIKYQEFVRIFHLLNDTERIETIRYAVDIVKLDDRDRFV